MTTALFEWNSRFLRHNPKGWYVANFTGELGEITSIVMVKKKGREWIKNPRTRRVEQHWHWRVASRNAEALEIMGARDIKPMNVTTAMLEARPSLLKQIPSYNGSTDGGVVWRGKNWLPRFQPRSCQIVHDHWYEPEKFNIREGGVYFLDTDVINTSPQWFALPKALDADGILGWYDKLSPKSSIIVVPSWDRNGVRMFDGYHNDDMTAALQLLADEGGERHHFEPMFRRGTRFDAPHCSQCHKSEIIASEVDGVEYERTFLPMRMFGDRNYCRQCRSRGVCEGCGGEHKYRYFENNLCKWCDINIKSFEENPPPDHWELPPKWPSDYTQRRWPR